MSYDFCYITLHHNKLEASNWKTQFSFLKRRTESLLFHGVSTVKVKKGKRKAGALSAVQQRGVTSHTHQQ